jgi:hypothetical protein
MSTTEAFEGYPGQFDAPARRQELQRLIEARALSVDEVDAYAAMLAAQFPGTDDRHRGVAHAGMLGYLDGWLAAYDAAYDAGLTEGYNFALLMVEQARGIYGYDEDGKDSAALQWVGQRITQERDAGDVRNCAQQEEAR